MDLLYFSPLSPYSSSPFCQSLFFLWISLIFVFLKERNVIWGFLYLRARVRKTHTQTNFTHARTQKETFSQKSPRTFSLKYLKTRPKQNTSATVFRSRYSDKIKLKMSFSSRSIMKTTQSIYIKSVLSIFF